VEGCEGGVAAGTRILSSISTSENRRKLLLFLKLGPKTWGEIKQAIGVSSQVMNPQIHILVDEGMVRFSGGRYELTQYGKAYLNILQPAIENISILEEHPDFWKMHYLPAIPDPLLVRISDIAGASLKVVDTERMFELRDLHIFETARRIRGIAMVVHPAYVNYILTATKRDIPLEIIIGPKAYNCLQEHHPECIKEFFSLKKSALFVHTQDLFLSMALTEAAFVLQLAFSTGDPDPRRDLFCHSERALKWGNDLFDWYRDRSRRIIF